MSPPAWSVHLRVVGTVGAVLVAGLGAACGSADGGDGRERPDGDRRGATKRAEPAPAPTGECTAGQIEQLVRSFVDAFNAGDSKVLDRLWVKGASFRWYSTRPPGSPDDPASRKALVPYLERRFRARERLLLRAVVFGGNSAGYGNFEFSVVRSAADLPATEYEGKGAAFCRDDRDDLLFVWSMAPS